MPNLTPLAIFLALGTIAISVLSQIELWQRKEYRWDRLRSWYRTTQGQKLITSWGVGLTLAIFFAWGYFLFTATAQITTFISWLIIIALAAYYLRRTEKRGLIRPHFTNKAKLTLSISALLIILFLTYAYNPDNLPILQLATLAWSIPIVVTLSVTLANIPTAYRKSQIIARATSHRANLSKLKVVAITGSYGKTSAKHFAAQLIRNALTSKNHRNTRIGIAQDVLEQLNQKTKVYIAEAGAYELGEVKQITDIIKPDISLITAIGNQHIELFGSLENILSAKWEIITALPKTGTAILNADDSRLVAKAKQLKNIEILWYSLKKPADIYATDIKINPTKISCTLHIQLDKQSVTIPLAGLGSLTNVLGAVAIATSLDIKPQEIFSRISTLKPFAKTMEIKSGINGSTIIDDSYSASEHGVINAIRHLDRFPQKNKIVILKSLIELGSESPAAHKRINQALQSIGAEVYLTDTDHNQNIAGTTIINPKKLSSVISTKLNPDTVVLLEGRLPQLLIQSIISS